ncbi:MAG: alpha/beta fold hydrolase [Patescibacteria group bacterium]
MEKEIKIKTGDGHIIYGTLNVPRKPTAALVVFVHGLTGSKNEHLFFNAAKLFPSKAIATFRFDLYSGEKNGRTLTCTTISTHAKDVDTVVNRFNVRYKKIFLVGHSLGGPSILLSRARNNVAGIILWDSAHTLQKSDEVDYRYDRHLKVYILSWGIEMLIGKRMFDDWKRLTRPKDLVKNVSVPIKVICAEKGILIRPGKEYYKYAKQPKEFMIIKKATHCFDERGTEEKLFSETIKFVKRHS